jgi:diguanylate cyclase (GGDEF)-like protein
MKSPAAVMLLDLDNFKTVNDTQGHPVGDKLLIEVANRVSQQMTENGIAARLGGDEFAVLISPVKNIKQVDRIAQQVLDVIAQPYIINDNEIQNSTTIGLAWLPKDGSTPDTILKHADLAMYQAKEMGRNQYRQFTEQLNEQLQRYIRFSREMPEALINGNFTLNFQPKMDLKQKRIIGVEGLVRWEHPELGLISPFDFISIAEDTGFIVPLGNWVFAQACRNMRTLREMGHPDISCAINISLRQFRDPSLLGVIEKSMRDNGINPQQIEVEITESLLMEDVDKAILTLREIQRLGISVAIDDFGTGYSSFSYLKNLPINVLKVDRCFIKDIPSSQEDMKITSAIISMAHSLNLKVVAEGIETIQQQQFLIEQNCDIGQGYLFGKPVKLTELKMLLDSENPSQQRALAL